MSAWTIRAFVEADTEGVVALWQNSGLTRPWNDPRRDIDRKMRVQPELFLVAALPDDDVVGSVMAGYDGHRGWLHYLATSSAHRRAGIGRALVAEAERRMAALGCPKVQLLVRPGNDAALAFYDALGYDRFHAGTAGKRLVVDGPGAPE